MYVPLVGTLLMYLLLLHELRIRTIIDHILAKNGRSERTVDLLRIHIAQLSIQNEVVALGPQAYRRLLTQEDKGEDIAVFLAA